MLIGGFALAAYGQIRATQNVDMAISASYEKSVKLQGRLQKLGYQLAPEPHPDAPLFFVTDLKEMLEVEMWTKPDGIVFDRETLRRRWKVRPFSDSFEMFAIGPEDFIVNKLARKNRGVQDEQDAISVLAMQEGRLDYPYLRKRAKQADVIELLETLMQTSKFYQTLLKRSEQARKKTGSLFSLEDIP
jgi:hypothetical protein